jgi:hypothetical protein
MTSLHQILAAEKGVKGRAERDLTNAYHTLQRTALLGGVSRTYQPVDDDGEKLPPESTLVQVNTADVIASVGKALTELFDVVLTKDAANQAATADVTVDGRVILPDVPVTTLLFLEKKLTDLHTFVLKLPTLDPADMWHYDPNRGYYATDQVQSRRTEKLPQFQVAYEATEHHPAQVHMHNRDITVGTWTTVKFSGALPAARVAELRDRVVALQKAVTEARQKANETPVTDRRMGEQVMDFLFN